LGLYLRHLEKVRTAEKVRAIVEMNRRHGAAAKLALDKITEAPNAIDGSHLPANDDAGLVQKAPEAYKPGTEMLAVSRI
jgi:hypothetical protein